jgi:hypothetical protein
MKQEIKEQIIETIHANISASYRVDHDICHIEPVGVKGYRYGYVTSTGKKGHGSVMYLEDLPKELLEIVLKEMKG